MLQFHSWASRVWDVFANLLYPKSPTFLAHFGEGIDEYEIKEIYREGKCLLAPEQKSADFAEECYYADPTGKSILIWGDSHAGALSYGFRENYPIVMQMTASGCAPLIGYNPPVRVNCQDINNFVLDKIGEIKPKSLILHANWSEPIDKIEPGLYQTLSQTIRLIKLRSPATKIIIVGGVPQWKPSLPKLLLRSHVELSDETFVYSYLYNKIQSTDRVLSNVANINHIVFVSLLDMFCQGNECLSSVSLEGKYEPFAWDYGHLTKLSSIIVSNNILELISEEPPNK